MVESAPAAPARPGAAGIGWLALAGVTWGTSGTIGTLLREASGLSPVAVAGYRIAVGGAMIAAFLLVAGRFRPPRTRAGWGRVAVVAATSAAYQFGFFSAIPFVGVAVATLIAIGATPPLVIAAEALTGRQRPTGRLAATLTLAAAGLVLLVGVSAPTGADTLGTLAGAGLALIASASFATISVLGARPLPGHSDATGTALAFLLGGAVVLAASGDIGFAPTPASVGLLAALGLIPSAVAYLSYFRGLRTQSGTTGSLVALLEPLTATTLATLVLGERLTPPAALGAGLLLAAVTLTASTPRTGEPRRRAPRG